MEQKMYVSFTDPEIRDGIDKMVENLWIYRGETGQNCVDVIPT
jgi:hypothetical protein